MGLGKTVQILGLVFSQLAEEARGGGGGGDSGGGDAGTLIVCPKALLGQWVAEVRRHAPVHREAATVVCAFYGGSRGSAATPEVAAADVVVTTYGVLEAEARAAASAQPEGTRRGTAGRAQLLRTRWQVSDDWVAVPRQLHAQRLNTRSPCAAGAPGGRGWCWTRRTVSATVRRRYHSACAGCKCTSRRNASRCDCRPDPGALMSRVLQVRQASMAADRHTGAELAGGRLCAVAIPALRALRGGRVDGSAAIDDVNGSS
jgi:hypothetical protein